MYRFQVRATTQPGERIALVGSSAKLGSWDPCHCIWPANGSDSLSAVVGRVAVEPGRWRARPAVNPTVDVLKETPRVEYRYLRVQAGGQVIWESTAVNRWVPLEPDLCRQF
jgi:hypothetical protein